jgi:GNAT superfamily N-acetyltransferase
VLIVTDADILDTDSYGRIIYEQLFGYAYPRINTAITSMYMLGFDFVRNAKNGIHEIGHLLGLKHCLNYYCVMHLAHSVEELDATKYALCEKCAQTLKNLRQVSSPATRGRRDSVVSRTVVLKDNNEFLRQERGGYLSVAGGASSPAVNLYSDFEDLLKGFPAEPNADNYAGNLAKLEAYINYFCELGNFIRAISEFEFVILVGEEIRFTSFGNWIMHTVDNNIHRLLLHMSFASGEVVYKGENTNWAKTLSEDFELVQKSFVFLQVLSGLTDMGGFIGNISYEGTEENPVPNAEVSKFVVKKVFLDDENASSNFETFKAAVYVMENAVRKIEGLISELLLTGSSSPVMQTVTIGFNVHRYLHAQNGNSKALVLTEQLYAYLRTSGLLDREIVLPNNIMLSGISAFVQEQLSGLSGKRLRIIGDGAYLNKCFDRALEGQFAFVANNPSTVLEAHLPLDVIYYQSHHAGDSSIEHKKDFVVSAVKPALWQRLAYEVYFDSGFVARGSERSRIRPVTVEMWSSVEKLIAALEKRTSSAIGVGTSFVSGMQRSERDRDIWYIFVKMNNLLVGDLEYNPNRSGYRDSVWVEDVYVEDEWRGIGVGHYLMAKAIIEAISMGKAKIIVPYTRLDRLAEKFYYAIGRDFSVAIEILPFGLFLNRVVYTVTKDAARAVENFKGANVFAPHSENQYLRISSSSLTGRVALTVQERVRRYIDNLYHEFYLRLNSGVREDSGGIIVDVSKPVLYGTFQHTPVEVLESVVDFSGFNAASNIYMIGGDGKPHICLQLTQLLFPVWKLIVTFLI